ncbi:MAG TPA: IS1595 family transposase [Candidatus Acidoferrales bacterium]|nr:IS1595 family transposase [Candidatus Acidoferrales bacterium]
MALLEMLQKFSTDEKCREILTKLRWPEGVTCPRCKERQVCYLTDRKQFECGSCSYQFSVTTGTIFNDTHLPLEKWFAATYLLCEAKKGMSACQIQRTLGISYKTAWYLCHRIRAAMAECDKPMLSGEIEMDETYVGGKGQGIQERGRGTKKRPVLGIRQRNGELRLFHAKEVTGKSLEKFLRENVGEDVDVFFTDELGAYKGVARRMGLKDRHQVVQHGIKQYVRGNAHTNTIESAFSLFKRGLRGSWHKLSAKHLQAYLEEMTFRFNRRKNPNLFLDTLRHMITAPVLTFEKLTA